MIFYKKVEFVFPALQLFYLNESLFKMVSSKTSLTYKKGKGHLDSIQVALKSYIVICFIFV
ncbi:hypothetical protein A9970_03525 [Sphingobacterium sp. UME9]|nr:hypothetical protein [Sphingobacterium sp. UME9]